MTVNSNNLLEGRIHAYYCLILAQLDGIFFTIIIFWWNDSFLKEWS